MTGDRAEETVAVLPAHGSFGDCERCESELRRGCREFDGQTLCGRCYGEVRGYYAE